VTGKEYILVKKDETDRKQGKILSSKKVTWKGTLRNLAAGVYLSEGPFLS
jgi:hypothetical protein